MKHSLTLTAAFLLTLTCAGCNTVHGVGQDLQKAGEKIQDVVKRK